MRLFHREIRADNQRKREEKAMRMHFVNASEAEMACNLSAYSRFDNRDYALRVGLHGIVLEHEELRRQTATLAGNPGGSA